MESNPDAHNVDAILSKIREQSSQQNLRITQHAHQEMLEENISLDELLEAIRNGRILENYPDHRRGSCCLLYGVTGATKQSPHSVIGGFGVSYLTDRHLHIVCTTTREVLIIITVYEAKSPKWRTPTQRNGS